MTTTTTYFKLGLLAVGSIAALVAILVVLGIRSLGESTVDYHTYFDESVQGLELGSPVKFRGVRIGSVTDINVAPDGHHIDVTLALIESDTKRLHFEHATPDFRARLGTQGLTGVKFVDLDFFPHAAVEELPFEPAEHFIAAHPSIIKGLETGGTALARRLPALVDQAMTTLDRFEAVLNNIEDSHIAARTSRTLGRIDKGIDLMGRRLTEATESFDRTMDEVADAAEAMRDLLTEIERDPDMLLKGRR